MHIGCRNHRHYSLQHVLKTFILYDSHFVIFSYCYDINIYLDDIIQIYYTTALKLRNTHFKDLMRNVGLH